MIEIRRILCPTDLSDIAPRAFDHALALARFHQAEVELAYVSEPLLPGPVAPASYPPWAILDPAVRGRLQSALEALAAPGRERGVPVRFGIYEGRVVRGDPRSRPWLAGRRRRHGHARPERVRALGARLGHGKGPPQGAVPGADRAPARRPGSTPTGRCSSGGSSAPSTSPGASIAALGYALKLAEESSAEITVLHVLEWLVEDEPAARIAGFDVPEFRRYLEKDARARLETLVPPEARDWCRPREEVVGGRPWREVLRVAEETQADVVVMGVRGRNPVDLALFGSTTQHVVRGARCPVLVVHTG